MFITTVMSVNMMERPVLRLWLYLKLILIILKDNRPKA